MWQNPPAKLTLEYREVHVWHASLEMDANNLILLNELLSVSEKQKIARLHFPKHREYATASRAFIKTVLAQYLKIAPQQLEFTYNEYGKPFLPGHYKANLQFNLSHSHNHAVLAIVLNDPVGIDIEQIRSLSHEDIAQRFFSAQEFQQFLALPPKQREEAFFLCWTRKEAYIKAIGKGMSVPLAGFCVSLLPEQTGLTVLQDTLQDGVSWYLPNIANDPHYKVSLALPWKPDSLQLWEWNYR